MIVDDLLIIIISIILQGFFSGIETGFISCNKIRIRYKMEKGNPTAKVIWSLLQNPHRMLSATLAGTNICVVTGSIFAAHLFIRFFGEKGPLLATAVMVPLNLIFGEVYPKAIYRMYTGKLLYITTPIFIFFQKILFPITVLVEYLSNIVIKGLGITRAKKDFFLTQEDIELLVKQITSEGVLERSEQGAIHQIFDFRHTRVGDIMVRLNDVVSIDYDEDRSKIIERAAKYKFTRYPVLQNKQIKGVLNIFDIFYNDGEWHKYIRPIKQVYANQRINRILYSMQRNKELMSAVVRKGKFIGIITFEDIIREIELI